MIATLNSKYQREKRTGVNSEVSDVLNRKIKIKNTEIVSIIGTIMKSPIRCSAKKNGIVEIREIKKMYKLFETFIQ